MFPVVYKEPTTILILSPINPISTGGTGIVKIMAKKILPVAAAVAMITHKANFPVANIQPDDLGATSPEAVPTSTEPPMELSKP